MYLRQCTKVEGRRASASPSPATERFIAPLLHRKGKHRSKLTIAVQAVAKDRLCCNRWMDSHSRGKKTIYHYK